MASEPHVLPLRDEVPAPSARVRAVPRSSPVVVIGAGPYGLSAAAHLAEAGVEVRAFGEPMESWTRHMPAGMLLRSRWSASQIADPNHALGLARFEETIGVERADPIPLDRFAAYGRRFQQEAVPQLEERRVRRVAEADAGGFDVELADGERLHASRVVVAAGIVPFATKPIQFQGLHPTLASHTADHPDLGAFRGRRVVVVGGGQSAVESAALLAEGGADVELLVREPAVRWLPEGDQINVDKQPRRYHAYTKVALGGPDGAWLVALPAAWPWIPRGKRLELAHRVIRPAAAGWLAPRMEGVTITCGRAVESASKRNGAVRLHLDDGTTRDAEHVLLATGYRIDVTHYPFLSPDLLGRIRIRDGHPVLASGFESSLPGLHFLGATAMPTFGPVMRFVAGTWASARGLTRQVVGRGVPRAGFSW